MQIGRARDRQSRGYGIYYLTSAYHDQNRIYYLINSYHYALNGNYFIILALFFFFAYITNKLYNKIIKLSV